MNIIPRIEERESAIRQVELAADRAWSDRAYDALVLTAQTMKEFISDDVWEVGGLESTREDRAMGPVFRRAAADGIAEKTDRVLPSVRSHLSGKPVWRSLIFGTVSLARTCHIDELNRAYEERFGS